MFGVAVAAIMPCVVLGALSSLHVGVVAAIITLCKVLWVLSLHHVWCQECCRHAAWGVAQPVIVSRGTGAWWALEGVSGSVY
jgi:hypothetical protein